MPFDARRWAEGRDAAGEEYPPERRGDMWHEAHGANDAAPPVAAPTPEAIGSTAKAQAVSHPRIVQLSTVVREPVTWLMQGWIPEGTLTILDGDPGMAKSTLTLDLAARVSRGWQMPPDAGGELVRPPGGVLLLGAEDSLQKTVGWRLDAAGADSTRVFYLDCIVQGESERDPVLPYDLLLLHSWLADHSVRLVIVDPLAAFIAQSYDAYKDQDIRRCLRTLRDFAEKHNVSLVLLRHLNKLNGGASLYRGGGSIGITGAARASLIVGRDPADDDTRVLAMNKLNLGPFPRSLAYRVDPTPQGVARIAWLGETDLKAHEILWHHTPQRVRAAHRPPDQLDAAKEFLNQWLGCGEPAEVGEIRRAAAAKALSWETVKRAKRDLEVQTYKIGSSWYWKLVQE